MGWLQKEEKLQVGLGEDIAPPIRQGGCQSGWVLEEEKAGGGGGGRNWSIYEVHLQACSWAHG